MQLLISSILDNNDKLGCDLKINLLSEEDEVDFTWNQWQLYHRNINTPMIKWFKSYVNSWHQVPDESEIKLAVGESIYWTNMKSNPGNTSFPKELSHVISNMSQPRLRSQSLRTRVTTPLNSTSHVPQSTDNSWVDSHFPNKRNISKSCDN